MFPRDCCFARECVAAASGGRQGFSERDTEGEKERHRSKTFQTAPSGQYCIFCLPAHQAAVCAAMTAKFFLSQERSAKLQFSYKPEEE